MYLLQPFYGDILMDRDFHLGNININTSVNTLVRYTWIFLNKYL